MPSMMKPVCWQFKTLFITRICAPRTIVKILTINYPLFEPQIAVAGKDGDSELPRVFGIVLRIKKRFSGSDEATSWNTIFFHITFDRIRVLARQAPLDGIRKD